MLIKDIPESFQLITNSQDIKSIIEDLDITDNWMYENTRIESTEDIGLLFVELIDGELNEVYAHFQSVPFLDYELEKLK